MDDRSCPTGASGPAHYRFGDGIDAERAPHPNPTPDRSGTRSSPRTEEGARLGPSDNGCQRTGVRRRHSGSATSVQVGYTSWAGAPGRFSACSVALRRSRHDQICTISPDFSVATNTIRCVTSAPIRHRSGRQPSQVVEFGERNLDDEELLSRWSSLIGKDAC